VGTTLLQWAAVQGGQGEVGRGVGVSGSWTGRGPWMGLRGGVCGLLTGWLA
jgi:hypothetical protein